MGSRNLHVGVFAVLLAVLFRHLDFVDTRRPDNPKGDVNVDESAVAPFEGCIKVIHRPGMLKIRKLLDDDASAHLRAEVLGHASLHVPQAGCVRVLERRGQKIRDQVHGHFQFQTTVPSHSSRVRD